MDTRRQFRVWMALLYVPRTTGMKLPVLTILAATAVVVFAAGGVVPKDTALATNDPAEVKSPSTGVMPAGPLFAPLTPEDAGYDPVTVPEPVWASVLAACAVSLLRRGRSY